MIKLYNLFSRRETTMVLLVSLLLVIVIARNTVVVADPQKEKLVDNVAYGNEPVEPLEVKLSGKSIKFKEKISNNDEEWLRDLSFKFKNKSDKPILFIEIALDFPETASSGPEMSYRLRLGRRPGGV